MKNYNTLIATLFVTLSFFSLALYTGCVKDPCEQVNCLNGGACNNGTCVCPAGYEGVFCENKNPCHDIVCQNGGTCVSGKCNCPSGYEGEFCQSPARDKFFGIYTGNEDCGFNHGTYMITVTANSNNNEFKIANLFDNPNFVVNCTLTGNSTFSLSNTQTDPAITGTGSINGSTLTIEYTISDGTTTYNCTYVGAKL